MRRHILPAVAAGLLGTATMLATVPATAQPYDRERGWFGERSEMVGEGRRGRSEDRDRYERGRYEDRDRYERGRSEDRDRYERGRYEDRDRYERDAFERGYLRGRDDERRRWAERPRTGREYGWGRGYDRRGERDDWDLFSFGDGLFD